MSAPRLPALFSIFKQRDARGFDYTPRYYDALKEERDERLQRLRVEADSAALREADRELLGARIRHSWHRTGSNRAAIVRLFFILGIVLVILYAVAERYGLL